MVIDRRTVADVFYLTCVAALFDVRYEPVGAVPD